MLQLRKMGAHVEFDGNDMEFEGVDRLHGAELSSYNDHRVLMALAVAGSAASGVTELSYPHAYKISYPEFADHMNTIGIPIAVSSGVPSSPGRPRIAVALITELVGQHARERPSDRAVVEVGEGGAVRTWTVSELVDAADRWAALLLGLGVRPGEPVAYQLPNVLEFVAISLGTLRIGAVCEPLMPIFREHELEFMLRESGARVLIVPSHFRGHDHAAMALRAQGARAVARARRGAAVRPPLARVGGRGRRRPRPGRDCPAAVHVRLDRRAQGRAPDARIAEPGGGDAHPPLRPWRG